MKKGLFVSCFVAFMSLFTMSCSDNTLTSSGNLDDETTGTNREHNYVFAVKSPKEKQLNNRAVGADNKKYWTPGETIRVKFLNGTSLAQKRVQEYSKIWEKYAFIEFDFVASNEEADVKVEFGYNGSNLSWSFIGTDCLDNAQTEATMGLIQFSDENLDDKTNNGDTREDFRAIVLRQFGHVLGLGFEHLNPDSDFVDNLDYDRTAAYLIRQGWPDYEVSDLLEAYRGRRVETSDFDENSIMMLYFPSYLTADGKEGKWNTYLSKGDILFIGKIYPFPKTKIGITYQVEGFANEYDYEAVKIGEYLWMDCNLYKPAQHTPTREAIDRALTNLGVDPSSYPVDMNDFNRYFGAYYARDTWGIDGRIAYPVVYEYDRDGNRTKVEGWNMHNWGAWEQLFAMCGDGSKDQIREYLGAKEGDNPCAYNPEGLTWFNGNRNVYDFNMMPGSSMFHNNGEMDRFFQDDRLVGHGVTFVIAPTHHHARYIGKLWHWMHARYSRRLTDSELGYKLYINASQTDIVKKGLEEAAPSGYSELANGYIRGFYVQYVLDNPNPEKTIAEIVAMGNHMNQDLFY